MSLELLAGAIGQGARKRRPAVVDACGVGDPRTAQHAQHGWQRKVDSGLKKKEVWRVFSVGRFIGPPGLEAGIVLNLPPRPSDLGWRCTDPFRSGELRPKLFK